MLTLPIPLPDNRYALLVMFRQINIDRMKMNDPFLLNIDATSAEWNNKELAQIIFATPSDEDIKEFISILDSSGMQEAIMFLARGAFDMNHHMTDQGTHIADPDPHIH